MLRMYQFRSGREMKDYYTAALAGGDYYLADEKYSRWRGDLAKRLGLPEEVTQETFAKMADNKHPLTGETLTPRTDDDRTVGYDINFSVPKSVSLVHAVTQDGRILAALRESVDETMREIERQIRTRVRIGGLDENRQAEGLAWGEFLHTVGRPVKGSPDPQLHIHCVVFNATFDPVEQRIKAGQFRDIKRDMPYFEAAMHSRLAWRMAELGYAVERDGKSWDIAGIPESARDKFANRSKEIDELARKLNITDAKRKAELGAKSRSKKTKGRKPDEIREEWLGRLTRDERKAIDSACGRFSRADHDRELSATREGLAYAIDHKFVRDSVVPEPRLMEAALRFGLGKFRPEALQKEAPRNPELLRKQEDTLSMVTTRKVLAEEEAMLVFARDGRGTCPALEGETKWSRGFAPLNAQQTRAIEHLLRSQDRVMLLRGGAGTGKTTLLRELSKAMTHRGHEYTVLAASVDASRGVLRDAGFGEANTVATFLDSAEMQKAARGRIWWVDEAGLIGTKTMAQLFASAQKHQGRVVLCGDSKQHSSVERGDAMRLLETRIGLMPAEMTEVVRQQGTYKQASEAMARGEFDKGIEILDQMGAIRELPGKDWVPLVQDYMDVIKRGQTAMVISPTHAEGDGITSLIRAAMQRDGKLSQDDRLMPQLKDLRWTPAERANGSLYRAGQVVQFHRAVGLGKNAFKPGGRFTVVGRDSSDRVTIRGADGKERILPLKRAASFGVNEDRLMRISEGELLRASGGGRTLDGKHRINNGAVYRVKGFTPEGNIRLDNGWVVSKDFGKWSHGYVSTSHAAQGRTVDWVFVAQGLASLPAASDAQFYVSVTRGRVMARIYTNNRRAIIEAFGRLNERTSATELLTGSVSERSKRHAATLIRLWRYEHERRDNPRRTRGHAYER